LTTPDISTRSPRDALALPVTYREPTSAAESKVSDIWQEYLKVEPIGLDDDFFDLGGDSLNAVDMSLAISEKFGVDFKPGFLLEMNTIAAVSKWLNDDEKPASIGNLICCRKSGEGPPIFLIHGYFGVALPHPEFMSSIDQKHPVHAFQIRGFDGKDEPFDRLEDIAKDYLASMLKVQPRPPWSIVAFCEGSWIAFEMVRQMRNMNLEPQCVILLDPALQSLQLHAEQVGSRVRLFGKQSAALSGQVSKWAFAYASQKRKFRMFKKTGAWIDPKLDEALQHPRVRKRLYGFSKAYSGKYAAKLKQRASDGQGGLGTLNLEMHNRFDDGATANASVLLQYAFWKYHPGKPQDFPFDLVISNERKGSWNKPLSPFNVYLPNRRLVQSGESHNDTISSMTRQSSQRIQTLISNALDQFYSAKN